MNAEEWLRPQYGDGISEGSPEANWAKLGFTAGYVEGLRDAQALVQEYGMNLLGAVLNKAHKDYIDYRKKHF